ncbi:MAG: hypothetical protein QM610_02350 [Chitinophagaceae bacterium]
MKKIFLSLSIAAISMTGYKSANAQVSVQLNIGGILSAAISSAPVVADAGNYYYYDDINCYYDVANSQYIYPENGAWYYSNTVPVIYRNYNFRNARHIAMDRRAFQGRGINARPFNQQQNMGYRNQMPGRPMEQQQRYAQQNVSPRQPQMQNRQQVEQRSITMNRNERMVRDANRRNAF